MSEWSSCSTLTGEEVDALGQMPQAQASGVLATLVQRFYEGKDERLGGDGMRSYERWSILQIIDAAWKRHLLVMDHLKEAIGFRGYGEKDPLVEYTKNESYEYFEQMRFGYEDEIISYLFRVEPQPAYVPDEDKTLLRLAHKHSDKLEALYEQRFAHVLVTAESPRYLTRISRDSQNTSRRFAKFIGSLFGDCRTCARSPSQLTNLGWSFDSDRLAEEFNIAHVSLINDFVAVGYGVLGLQPNDLYTLQKGNVKERSPIGVIGAGTGLGEAYLGWNGDRYEVYATEGGHTDFAPRNELEIELLQYLQKRHDRVSVERVVSGMGIVAIYQFLRDRQFAPEFRAAPRYTLIGNQQQIRNVRLHRDLVKRTLAFKEIEIGGKFLQTEIPRNAWPVKIEVY